MRSKCNCALALATAFAVAAAGCDSSATGTSSGGDAPAASSAAPAWNGAAADPAKLLGLWVAGDRRLDDGDEKSARMEQGLAERTMQFDFRDGERVFIQLGRDADVEQGRWQVVRADGASLVVRIASPSCDEREFRIAFVDDNRATMAQESDADGRLVFTLTRLRGAS
jgi:hypothetical protein